MKKVLIGIGLLSVFVPAFAATALFTGRQEIVMTVTHQVAWNCQYNYLGQTFWQVFTGSCPSSVEVQ